LIANKDREIARLEAAYIAGLQTVGATLVKSRAVLEDEHTVRLVANGAKVRARYILVATGGRPANGTVPGIEHVISSNEAFHLPEFPSRILIQGGGYIAVEFACIFAGLGAEVTLVYRGENILRGFDDDVRSHLRAELEKNGIRVLTGRVVAAVEKTASGMRSKLSDAQTIESDRVMFAIGRRPNVTGFGLERLGVAVADNGGLAVDPYSRTSISNIYAIGDVTNRVNLTPVAIREGHAFADTVFGNRPTIVDHAHVPTAVFSEPEVGVIGMTEAIARARLPAVDIYRTSFRPMKATLSGRDTCMLMKLVVDGSTDCVLGCHLVGPDAAELIQMAAVAVTMRARKADFDATMALHPTAAEELVTMRTPVARHRRQAAE
jgi:glutathione reductase (NADPH)